MQNAHVRNEKYTQTNLLFNCHHMYRLWRASNLKWCICVLRLIFNGIYFVRDFALIYFNDHSIKRKFPSRNNHKYSCVCCSVQKCRICGYVLLWATLSLETRLTSRYGCGRYIPGFCFTILNRVENFPRKNAKHFETCYEKVHKHIFWTKNNAMFQIPQRKNVDAMFNLQRISTLSYLFPDKWESSCEFTHSVLLLTHRVFKSSEQFCFSASMMCW